jgi:capsular polysaccharide biosynthesis protein
MDTIGGQDPDIQYDESISSSGQPGEPSRGGPRGFIGRLVRRLPRIAMLWLIISMPGVYLVHLLIEPTYESSSTLRIEPSPDLFGPSAKGNDADFGQYLETQRALILSNRVLEPAVAYVANLPGYPSYFPVIGDSTDPKLDVRKRLDVKVIPGTYLIQISFSSPSAVEAAEVVNRVVSAFEQQHKEFSAGMNAVARSNLDSYLQKLHRDIEGKQDEMIALWEKFERQVSKPAGNAEKPHQEQDTIARSMSGADKLKIEFLRDELTSLKSMRDSVRRKVEQLAFESLKGKARADVVDAASASKTPRSDSRRLWMMVLPPAVFFVLLGFFLVLDTRPQARPTATRDQNLP